MPDARQRKEKEKRKKCNARIAIPKCHLHINGSPLSLITAQRSSSHLRTPKAKIPKVEKTKNQYQKKKIEYIKLTNGQSPSLKKKKKW